METNREDNREHGRRQVIRPTRRVSGLLGFLLKAEVDAIFQQQPFETESRARSTRSVA